MTLSSPNLMSSGGNQGALLRSLREYLGMLEGGGSGAARATTALGGIPYIAGLVPSNAADATNDITFTAGVARGYNSGNETCVLALTAAMTKQLDAAWAKGTNAGALDTGAVGNNTYHWWLIGNGATREVDILASLSASAPTMPAGFTYKRRIFSFRRIAGANQVIDVTAISGGGLKVEITPVNEWNTAAPGTSAVTVTLANIPTGIIVRAKIGWLAFSPNNAGQFGLITALSTTDTAPSTTIFNLDTGVIGAVAVSKGSEYEVTTNTSAQIRYRLSSSQQTYGTALGWIDDRIS